ncbi:hypothetical protein SDJN03_21133, partial [Cucurbita argyrosperma subsp. sororia]
MNSPDSNAGAGAGAAEMGEERPSTGDGKNEDIFWEALCGGTGGEADIAETAAGDTAKKAARDKATQKNAAAAAVAIDVGERFLRNDYRWWVERLMGIMGKGRDKAIEEEVWGIG